MIGDCSIKEMLEALANAGRFKDEKGIANHVMARMNDLSSRLLVGQEVARKKEKGEITLKPLKELSDEEFKTLVFDFYISDRQMAKIFDVSSDTIGRRRTKLGIARNNSEGQFQMYQWILSDRIAPDVDTFLKSISA